VTISAEDTPTATGVLHVSLPDAWEWALCDGIFALRLSTVHGRMAARAFAYSIAAEDPGLARAILDKVGREG
jgi:hypothetical protein